MEMGCVCTGETSYLIYVQLPILLAASTWGQAAQCSDLSVVHTVEGYLWIGIDVFAQVVWRVSLLSQSCGNSRPEMRASVKRRLQYKDPAPVSRTVLYR